MEKIRKKNAVFFEQPSEKGAPPKPVIALGHIRMFRSDGSIVFVEAGGGRAENRHVAIEE